MVVMGGFQGERPVVSAQAASEWSLQQRIPGYTVDTLPPYLVADGDRNVHAFASQWLGEPGGTMAIVYSRWRRDQGWTYPTDILLAPNSNIARVEGVFMDAQGYIHLAFFGGNDAGASMFYSRAYAGEADQASAWSAPMLVGRQAASPSNAAIVGDANGRLIVVYSGNRDGKGLYAAQSLDAGATWSEPAALYLTYDDRLAPFFLQMHAGASGTFHAVWNVVDQAGSNVSGYYANYQFESQRWTIPLEVDRNVGAGIAIPAVIEHAGEVLLMYNNGLASGGAPVQWFRRSVDGGQNWTEAVRPFARHIGRNGTMSFVVDGNDGLHLFFGQRIGLGGALAVHGMWHSLWLGNTWSEPEPVVSGPLVNDLVGERGFDPYDASAVVSQGNVILVTWRSDPGQGRNGAWYAFKQLDAPEAALSVPSRPAALTPTAAAPATLAPATQEGSGEALSNLENEEAMDNPAGAIVLGVVPALALLGVLIVLRARAASRR
jgi:hypothetical protein